MMNELLHHSLFTHGGRPHIHSNHTAPVPLVCVCATCSCVWLWGLSRQLLHHWGLLNVWAAQDGLVVPVAATSGHIRHCHTSQHANHPGLPYRDKLQRVNDGASLPQAVGHSWGCQHDCVCLSLAHAFTQIVISAFPVSGLL